MHVHTSHTGSGKHAPAPQHAPNKASSESNNQTPQEKKHLEVILKTTAAASFCLSHSRTAPWECLHSCRTLKTQWRLHVSNSKQNRGLSATSVCTCSIKNKGPSWLWTWDCVKGTVKEHFVPLIHTHTHTEANTLTHSPKNQSITFCK